MDINQHSFHAWLAYSLQVVSAWSMTHCMRLQRIPLYICTIYGDCSACLTLPCALVKYPRCSLHAQVVAGSAAAADSVHERVGARLLTLATRCIQASACVPACLALAAALPLVEASARCIQDISSTSQLALSRDKSLAEAVLATPADRSAPKLTASPGGPEPAEVAASKTISLPQLDETPASPVVGEGADAGDRGHSPEDVELLQCQLGA